MLSIKLLTSFDGVIIIIIIIKLIIEGHSLSIPGNNQQKRPTILLGPSYLRDLICPNINLNKRVGLNMM